MPQAIEWSLATPMTRPRLPAISDDSRAIGCTPEIGSVTVVSTSGMVPPLRLIASEQEAGIGAAEAERIRQHQVQLGIVRALALDRQVGNHRVPRFAMRGRGADPLVQHPARPEELSVG